jgi:hypothetical protein
LTMIEQIFILFLMIQVGTSGDYPLKNGKPTSKGIEQYVEENSDRIIKEYQDFVDDTLYNIWIYTDDLNNHEGREALELGSFFPHEIYITTEELFEAYELDDLSPDQQGRFRECNKFVKATMVHELSHEYVNQVGVEMQSVLHIPVDKSYQTGLWIVKSHTTFGSSFIEEGINEYIVEKMGELIPPSHVDMPNTMEALMDKEREYMTKYKCSSAFLKTFLDTTGIKKGIQILLYNPPPSYKEILEPDRFFGRLVIPH